MDGTTKGAAGRRLRAVGGDPVTDPAVLRDAAEACVAAAQGGIPPRALGAAVAGHLGVEAGDVAPDALMSALGLLIATGRVDEVGGRLLHVAEERREAG
jgi:hypothetical protein